MNEKQYDLTIIVPVYNEEQTITAMLEELVGTQELTKFRVQYIVVDDGSSDGTRKILEGSPFKKNESFILLFHQVNKGKGSAIRTALPHAQGEYTIIQDADLEYRPADIALILQKARADRLDAVYGSRNLKRDNLRGTPFFYWGGKAVTWVANLLFGQHLTDEPTCYKLVKTSVLQSLPLLCRRFEFCQEVTALLSLRKIHIPEVPISYVPRSITEGKKIRMSDGIKGIWTLVRVRCTAWNVASLFILVTLIAGLVYVLTWHARFGGYEGETVRTALSFFDGTFEIKRAGLGALILYIPFILFFKLFSISNDHTWYLSTVPLFYSALSVGFIFLCAYVLTQKKSTAIGVSILITCASSIWPYSNVGMEYQATLIISVLLCALLYWSKRIKNPLWVGLVFAFLILTKSYGFLFFLPLVVFVFIELKKQGQISYLRSLSWLAKLVIPGAIAFGFLILWNLFVGGKIGGAYSIAHEFQIWTWWEGIYGVFFSAGKSIFLYAPLLIITLCYWMRFFKEYSSTAHFLCLSFLVLFGITAPFSYWSDETWGVRKLMPIIPLLHLPLISMFSLKPLSDFWHHVFFKRLCIGIFIFISVYIQFIGSIYGYGTYLGLLREANLDSLQHMRFIPQTSHVVMNHSLFISFLGRGTGMLIYKEASWFRWLYPGQHDVVFKNSRVDLTQFHTPKVFWFQPVTQPKLILFFSMVVVLIFLAGMLRFSYQTHSRLEN